MAATYVKFQQFVEDLATGVHNLTAAGDTVKVYLSNATPSVSLDAIKTDLAEITNENGYTAPVDAVNDMTETGGTATFTCTSLTITATGGTVGPFQYVVLYNDTPVSPVDPLIAYWDYGSAITLQDGETFDIKFNNAAIGVAGNVFTLA